MAIHPINAECIRHLDGGAAGAIIDAAIREAVQDLDDRGEDDKPRFVEIKLSLSRRENGLVETSVEAAAKLPRRRTASMVSRLKRDAQGQSRLVFQEFDNDAPDQTTIDEFAPKPTENE